MKTTYTRLHCGLTVRGLAWVLLGLGSMIGLGACAPETTPEIPETVAVETYMVGDIKVRTDGLSAHDNAYRTDEITFEIEPGVGFEYKYRLEQGETLLYSWTATGPVNYELHAEPDGAPRGYAQTYELRQAASQASGTLTAPFSGIHGWFWENLGDQEVTVTLTAAGFYNISHEFRAGVPVINKMFQ